MKTPHISKIRDGEFYEFQNLLTILNSIVNIIGGGMWLSYGSMAIDFGNS